MESLLAQEEKADGFIESPALEMAARDLAQDEAPSLVGRQMGVYQIVDHLGAGGMGEVCRAKDSELGREVAIKVLPAEFTRDVDRLARFKREAQLLAALNHPNVAALYGLEESEGIRFLVLELVEGEGPASAREGPRDSPPDR